MSEKHSTELQRYSWIMFALFILYAINLIVTAMYGNHKRTHKTATSTTAKLWRLMLFCAVILSAVDFCTLLFIFLEKDIKPSINTYEITYNKVIWNAFFWGIVIVIRLIIVVGAAISKNKGGLVPPILSSIFHLSIMFLLAKSGYSAQSMYPIALQSEQNS